MPSYESLEWDSSFFGFPVARIRPGSLSQEQLGETLHEMRRAEVELAYWFAADSVLSREVAEFHRGFLADRKTTYVADLRELDPNDFANLEQIEFFQAKIPTPELEELAIESGGMSRFRKDPRMPKGRFEELYRTWIRKSVEGTMARGILIAKDSTGAIAGMVTLGEKCGRGDIGLLAVTAAARGRKLGRCLVNAAQREFISRGFKYVQVVTQGSNQPACQLYESCGFSVEKVELVFHFWLDS
jgi:dTDP-4-amino-4,6-dideoxy-D-galactose acyltransferase